MCGWLSLPASAASARNALCIMRSVCGLMFSSNRNTLMATSRSANGSRARYTRLVAPLPISRTIGYLPRCSWSSNFIAIGRVSWKNARSGGAPRSAATTSGSLNGFSKSVLAVSSSMLQAVPDPDGEPVQQLARRSARPRAQRGLGIRVPPGLDRRILEVVLLRARVNVAVAFVHGDAVLAIHGVSFLCYGAVHYTDMGMNGMLVK